MDLVPPRHGDNSSVSLGRNALRQDRRRRCWRNLAPWRGHCFIGRGQRETGVGGQRCAFHGFLREAGRCAHFDRPGHEFIHEFVQAGLAAQMLHPRPQPVARVPPAQAKLSSLLKRHKPMDRQLLLRCADVARYCLPDQCVSPSSPNSLADLWSFEWFRSFLGWSSRISLFHFIAPARGSVSLNGEESDDESILNRESKQRPEMEQVDRLV